MMMMMESPVGTTYELRSHTLLPYIHTYVQATVINVIKPVFKNIDKLYKSILNCCQWRL